MYIANHEVTKLHIQYTIMQQTEKCTKLA